MGTAQAALWLGRAIARGHRLLEEPSTAEEVGCAGGDRDSPPLRAVEDIGWLDAKKRVLGIDVKWSKPGEGEGLLVEDGVIHAVDMTGKKRTIEVVQP